VDEVNTGTHDAELGHIKLQKLRPAHVHGMKLLKRGGHPYQLRQQDERARILKAALQSAVDIELISRNVGSIGKRVAAEDDEVCILGPEDYGCPRGSERRLPVSYRFVCLSHGYAPRRSC